MGHPGYLFCAWVKPLQTSPISTRVAGMWYHAMLVWLEKKAQLYQYAKVFYNANSLKEDVIKAAERALVAAYGGKVSDSLEALRYRRFCEMTAERTTAVEVKSLPPTSSVWYSNSGNDRQTIGTRKSPPSYRM